MSNEPWDLVIDLRKDPYRVNIRGLGEDRVYEFIPELDSELAVTAFRKIQKIRGSGDGEFTAEKLEAMLRANREYLATLMLPDSRERFMSDPLPDRVTNQITQAVMAYYNDSDRPTGPSSGSSATSSAGGRHSTGPSRSKA